MTFELISGEVIHHAAPLVSWDIEVGDVSLVLDCCDVSEDEREDFHTSYTKELKLLCARPARIAMFFMDSRSFNHFFGKLP